MVQRTKTKDQLEELPNCKIRIIPILNPGHRASCHSVRDGDSIKDGQTWKDSGSETQADTESIIKKRKVLTSYNKYKHGGLKLFIEDLWRWPHSN